MTATTEGTAMPTLLVPMPAPPAPDPKPATLDEAIAHLATLAGPNEVKELLVEHGVKGARRNGWKCAIAAYLNRFAAPGDGIGVTPISIYVRTQGTHSLDIATLTHLVPSAVRRFIWLFDEGMYPELEEK